MKAIFVDGANLFNCGRILGIGRFNFAKLLEVLTNIGDDKEIFERPVYTIPAYKMEQFGKVLNSTGFKPVEASSFHGSDDNFIKNGIINLPDTVSEIVLVSADADFLTCIRAAARKGVKVFVVSTNTQDSNSGKTMISQQMKDEFSFVDLADFKDMIMLGPWIPKENLNNDDIENGVRSTGDGRGTQRGDKYRSLVIQITMDGRPSDIARLLDSMTQITADFPSVQMTINLTS